MFTYQIDSTTASNLIDAISQAATGSVLIVTWNEDGAVLRRVHLSESLNEFADSAAKRLHTKAPAADLAPLARAQAMIQAAEDRGLDRFAITDALQAFLLGPQHRNAPAA